MQERNLDEKNSRGPICSDTPVAEVLDAND
jgi:hypothetical protein